MYQNLKETLEEMFEKGLSLLENFNREEYRQSFCDYKETYKTFLNEQLICPCGKETDGKWMDKVSRIIPQKAARLLDVCSTKAEQNQELLKYNMAMSVFVLPAFCGQKEPVFEIVSKKMVQAWQEMFGQKLKIVGPETILGTFRERLCYVTTAVCQGVGKADDCRELGMLRRYRDEYLVKECHEEELVKSYYNMAPTIVNRINREKNAKEIYQNIWETYLRPCVSFIGEGKMEECRGLYTKMVTNLREQYLYTKKEEENNGQ